MKEYTMLLFSAALLAAAAVTGAEKPDIQKIKDLYGRIEADIRAGRLVAKTYSSSTGDPNVDPSSWIVTTAKSYSKPGSRAVDKISRESAMTNITEYEEFVYYPDGSPALYYRSDRLSGGGPAREEDRYYFSGGACIRVIEDRMDVTADETMKRAIYDPPLPKQKRMAAGIFQMAKENRARCVAGKSPIQL